jgi:hypothetical protein
VEEILWEGQPVGGRRPTGALLQDVFHMHEEEEEYIKPAVCYCLGHTKAADSEPARARQMHLMVGASKHRTEALCPVRLSQQQKETISFNLYTPSVNLDS